MCTYSGNYRGRTVGFVFIGIAGLAAVIALVMVLWNWLIPVLFSGPVITYWQAAGILILSKVIFSGYWGHKHHHSDYRHRTWRRRFEEKMRNMSEEEKERFRARFHRRAHWHRPYDEEKRENKADLEDKE
jgi:hypothetical protein